MNKINFVNNSEPALSAETLNQMQDNIEKAIPKKVSELSNDNYYISSIFQRYTCANMDEFKNYLLTSNVPEGVSIFFLNITSASYYCAIVFKLSSSYLSYILFGYSQNAIQYQYIEGTWSQIKLT